MHTAPVSKIDARVRVRLEPLLYHHRAKIFVRYRELFRNIVETDFLKQEEKSKKGRIRHSGRLTQTSPASPWCIIKLPECVVNGG